MVVRDDALDEALRRGVGGTKLVCGEEEATGPSAAGEGEEARGGAPSGSEAKPGVLEAEPRTKLSDAKIAGESKLSATAEREAIDRRNDGNIEERETERDRTTKLEKTHGVLFRSHGAKVVEVCTGREHTVGAREHDGAKRAITGGRTNVLGELTKARKVQGVLALRTIDAQYKELTVSFALDHDPTLPALSSHG